MNLRIVTKGLHKEVCSNLWRIKGRKRLHHNDIHQTVLHRSPRCDICVVAILRGIGTSYQKGLVTTSTCCIFYLIGFGLIFQSFTQHILDISDGATFASFCKLERYKGIESHTACTEEGLTIDDTIIEFFDLTAVD